MGSRLSKLKWAFYEWLGALSTQEIMSNSNLMEAAKHVERLLFQNKV